MSPWLPPREYWARVDVLAIAITFAMNVETRWRDGLKEILLRAVARGTCSAPGRLKATISQKSTVLSLCDAGQGVEVDTTVVGDDIRSSIWWGGKMGAGEEL